MKAFAPIFAQTETEIPTNLEEVRETLASTLGEAWKSFVEHIPLLGVGLLVLIATWVAAKIGSTLVSKAVGSHVRESLRLLLGRFVTIGVWVGGLLLAAIIVFPGLTPAKALGGLGIASVAIGFAFKDIFENFFAGILILWRFPIENGDFIECEGISGKVEDVEIRMTKIRKTSGELVVLPNSFLFKNAVDVLTDQNTRRVTITTGVAYDEDVSEAVEVITKAVEDCESVNKDKPIQIFPEAFGASSIDIEVTWWTGPLPVDVRRSRGEVITAVKKALDDAGIEIPFPYRTLTFKEALPIANTNAEAEKVSA